MLKTMERAVESSELGDVFPLPIDPSMDDGQRAEVSANDAAAMLSDGHGGRTFAGPHARRQTFEPHELVVMEGNVARNLYEVMEGAVMLYKLLPDGRRQVVELISPGDVFGFGLEDIHDCSAETLMPTRLCIISQDAVDRCPEIQKRLLQHTREQLLHMHHHAVLLGRKSAMERVASFIERLARTGGAAESLRLAMTRQEIADYLGLTIETVSRSFSELRRRGLVICERQDRIRVPDLKGISQLTGA